MQREKSCTNPNRVESRQELNFPHYHKILLNYKLYTLVHVVFILFYLSIHSFFYMFIFNTLFRVIYIGGSDGAEVKVAL